MTWGCSHRQEETNINDKEPTDTEISGLRVILVRHAEAFRNTPERGSVPVSKLDTLTPQGIKQADAVGTFLKDNDVQVAKVVTAPTGRASQTAAVIMKVLGLQGKPVKDVAVNSCQAGETSADRAARIMGAIAELEQTYKGKTVVIVTHQHLMHCVLDRATHTDKGDESFHCPPGSMKVIHIDKDEWKIAKNLK